MPGDFHAAVGPGPGATGVTDGAGVNFGDGFAHAQVVAPAETRHHGEVFTFRLGGGFEHGTDASAVDGDRFFAEHVFAGGDGGFQVLRAEGGSRCE